MDDIRAVIISPTRELAEQISVEARKVTSGTGIVVQTAVGGTQKRQHMRKMQYEGCHILVGTPGRTSDILSDPGTGVALPKLDAFVMDEADRLLDMNFTAEIDTIKSFFPRLDERDRQTMMFSATLPQSVIGLVRRSLKPDFKFVRTVSADEVPTHERIPQKVVFLHGLQNQLPAVFELAQRCIQAQKEDPTNNLPFKAIIYFGATTEVGLSNSIFQNLRDETKAGGRWAPHPLEPCGLFEIHSRLDQRQRTRAADSFRAAETAILFSSDVTSRGMDFPNVTHVIQVGLPHNSDDYIHRIGRTGRAGKSGEGWLLIPDILRREFQYSLARDLPIKEDRSISTASVDMTRDAQLPTKVAQILSTIQTAVRGVPTTSKFQAYMSLLSALKLPNKQMLVDTLNNLSKYGWGLATPPRIAPMMVKKLGFSNVQGLNIGEAGDQRLQSGMDSGQGRGSGGRAFGRSRQDDDPFGRGAIEPGNGGNDPFGGRDRSSGGSSGGYGGRSGGSNGGYGGRSSGSGGGYGGRSGGSGGGRSGGYGNRSGSGRY